MGDGTTSVVVLAGELLREAEQLVAQKIHPMTIIAGFREACGVAKASLAAGAFSNVSDGEAFRRDLENIAMTTLSSKILTGDKEHFARLAVDAILRLKGSGNLDAIHLIKKPGGSLRDSFLDEGFILDKRIGVGCPRRVENARVLIANTPMDTDKVKIYGARVKVDSMAKVADIEAAEKAKMKEKCEKILAHGINCFVNRQLIYNYPEEILADAGVMSIEHADFDGVERLALVLGGEIVSTFDSPEDVKLGTCKLIEEVMIGEDRLLHFSGVALGEACTIVLRGASTHILDEADRSLHDALCVLSETVKDTRVVFGGGWPEMRMARAVEEAAKTTPGERRGLVVLMTMTTARIVLGGVEDTPCSTLNPTTHPITSHQQQHHTPNNTGKRSIAMEAFARALRALPTTICDNAGLDSAEIVATLRAVSRWGSRGFIFFTRWGGQAVWEGVGCFFPVSFSLPPPFPPRHTLSTPNSRPHPNAPIITITITHPHARRQEHGRDPDSTRAGVDITRGAAGDMRGLGVYESFRVKNQVVTSAVEAAEMILRVDDIIRAAPRRR